MDKFNYQEFLPELHKHFAANRLNGEWFKLTQSQLKEIDSLLSIKG